MMRTCKRPLIAALVLFLAFSAGAGAADLETLKTKARRGNTTAQTNLGGMYYYGQGVAQDYGEALQWYRLAAAQGYAEAQTNLGGMYYYGLGVAQDYFEAYTWYRLAAAQGLAQAQAALGDMYGFGQGVAQDYIQAYTWWSLAAAIDTTVANKRDKVAKMMTPAQIAAAQRRVQEWKPKAAR